MIDPRLRREDLVLTTAHLVFYTSILLQRISHIRTTTVLFLRGLTHCYPVPRTEGSRAAVSMYHTNALLGAWCVSGAYRYRRRAYIKCTGYLVRTS